MTKWRNDEFWNFHATYSNVFFLKYKLRQPRQCRDSCTYYIIFQNFVISSHLFYWHANHIRTEKKNQLVYNWIFIPVWNECRNGYFKKSVEINLHLHFYHLEQKRRFPGVAPKRFTYSRKPKTTNIKSIKENKASSPMISRFVGTREGTKCFKFFCIFKGWANIYEEWKVWNIIWVINFLITSIIRFDLGFISITQSITS